MKSSIQEELVRDMASRMNVQRLVDEVEKTKDPKLKKVAQEQLKQKMTCDECGNGFMEDVQAGVLYCPAGCIEVDIDGL